MTSFTLRQLEAELYRTVPDTTTEIETDEGDLVLTPSILLDAKRPPDKGCHWHGFVGSSGIQPGHAG